MRPNPRSLPPLDSAALERLALRYVERFATTRAKLADYLTRKVRLRGWQGAVVDPRDVAERMAALGYIDDLAFGEARAAAMARRGLGARRVVGALRQAGLVAEDAAAIAPAIADRAVDAALAFARRRRIGPYAPEAADRDGKRRQLAAMIRGGHDMTLARRIVSLDPGEVPEDFFGTG